MMNPYLPKSEITWNKHTFSLALHTITLVSIFFKTTWAPPEVLVYVDQDRELGKLKGCVSLCF
jgi:hypothetical protein